MLIGVFMYVQINMIFMMRRNIDMLFWQGYYFIVMQEVFQFDFVIVIGCIFKKYGVIEYEEFVQLFLDDIWKIV